MLILGLDPGTTRLGFGIIKKEKGCLTLVTAGCIETSAGQPAKKLHQLERQLQQLIKKHQPEAIAIEKLFFAKNQKTALAVAEAKGVLMLCAQKTGQPVFYYTPLQIKQAVVGYGRADKKQVQQMIKIILKLKAAPRPDDAADAVATAVCCAHSENFDALPRPHAS
ncbi:MAG: crossover junction endodeoxyribonuclease RuvC [Candidatus Portnoybacteria bacterium CG10_big_fil_rev_8_21_14_0_10_44_7]|uniref:Crossover junction endodeoxyribonuclease RuvC n=1 Tax=Candidatus Portnoybacteria bacterium CG10_big_fil_rev_8_21_14_0_10_44_7 TaxID=1974816 RepID=A0A2M8KJ27_9BACT|nr:MAG: crossover junction endodeoxyribonuclease RuvC [Candidatus Portnoybacteria bacterium CG10_big_fil_rev_8_21_14_0_10_44_7]